MPIYISMLRGINVGGNRLVKMDKLRASFEGLGFEKVQTYIQSGNVIFKAGKTSPEKLSRKIEGQLTKQFGFEILVITRTLEELGQAIAGNPFLKERGLDPQTLHVAFFSEVPAADARKELGALTKLPDRCQIVAGELFLHLPNGMGKS